METIRRGSKRYKEAILGATGLVHYCLDNGFQGQQVPAGEGALEAFLNTANTLKAKLRRLDDGRYRLTFNSNSWLEFRLPGENTPAPAPEPGKAAAATTAGFGAAVRAQIADATGRDAATVNATPAMVWTREDVVALMARSDDAVCAALVGMFNRQTSEEQQREATVDLNGVGFSGQDADFMSSLAKGVLKWGHLTARQLPHARRNLKKYAGQIAEIANAEGWTENVKPPQPEQRPARRDDGRGRAAGNGNANGNGNGNGRNRCRRCNGTGTFTGRNGRALGPCFTCNGRGYLTAADFARMRERRPAQANG